MVYNVTLADATGNYATVYLSPDRAPVITQSATCNQSPGKGGMAGICRPYIISGTETIIAIRTCPFNGDRRFHNEKISATALVKL